MNKSIVFNLVLGVMFLVATILIYIEKSAYVNNIFVCMLPTFLVSVIFIIYAIYLKFKKNR